MINIRTVFPSLLMLAVACAGYAQNSESSDGTLSVGAFYWLNPTNPVMRSGRAASSTSDPANLDYPGTSKPSPGVVVSLPAGHENTLRLSYFQTSGHGDLVAGQNLAFFATGYSAGDYLNTRYKIQNVKLSLDYLSWPFPTENARLRVKTLWELQYTTMRTEIDAPSKETADNPQSAFAAGSNWFIYPSLGMGVEYQAARNLRFEAKGSGFALPHRSALGDTEAIAAYRHGQFEIFGGAKLFHFKTSPRQEQYVHATLMGAYAGIRWYPKY